MAVKPCPVCNRPTGGEYCPDHRNRDEPEAEPRWLTWHEIERTHA